MHFARKISYLLLLLSPTYAIFAQTERRINFSVGLAHTNAQDLEISRFACQGINLPIRLNYEMNRLKSQEYVTLGFASGKISSSTDFNSSLKQLLVTYGYNHQVFHFTGWQPFLGGEWNTGYFQRITTSINQPESASLFSGLRIFFRGVINLPKEQQLQVSLGLPLVAYTIRSGYANSTATGLIGEDRNQSNLALAGKAGTWSSFDKFNYSNISLFYTRNFAKNVSVRWAYTFSWYCFNEPLHSQRMTLLNNELTCTLSYLLKQRKKDLESKP